MILSCHDSVYPLLLPLEWYQDLLLSLLAVSTPPFVPFVSFCSIFDVCFCSVFAAGGITSQGRHFVSFSAQLLTRPICFACVIILGGVSHAKAKFGRVMGRHDSGNARLQPKTFYR